ncbi:MAG: hypothetical protein EPO21_24165 [Chloroflexota bacterium]|nr:MAG: hypothetical protein EPO21_24165 [Chloroflexota bacterium]
MSFEAAMPVRGGSAGVPQPTEEQSVLGLLSLTPAESKRLIARATVQLPEVRHALSRGRVMVAAGTTTAYIAEEIMGTPIEKYRYAAGIISQGTLTTTEAEEKIGPFCLYKGSPVEEAPRQFLEQFTADDVFIKSANAVDVQGMAGVLMAGLVGGTMGIAFALVTARGSHFVVPVGLEKLVPSVPDAARKAGILRFKYALGMPVGLMPVVGATVVTEIQALRILADVQATQIAAGGIHGSEGSVVLSIEGPDAQVSQAIEIIRQIKGEPAIRKER